MRTNEAEGAFRRYLERRGLVVSRLNAEEAVDTAIGFFESERADDVEAEMGDMLLFQWGTYDWHDGNGPSFQFELARQFVVAGFAPDQADDAMWQLHLTLHYRLRELPMRSGRATDGVNESRMPALSARSSAPHRRWPSLPRRAPIELSSGLIRPAEASAGPPATASAGPARGLHHALKR
ncbi:MAG TPA: hypothetical protein VIX86_15025 [Streptosporangiaceae bacterium]